MNHEFIRAENISFSVSGASILRECNFSVARGTITVITGPSGSGKTTLGKLLAGQYAPSGGIITLAQPGIKRVFVDQQHDFRFALRTTRYFGQRFDRDYENDFPTVFEILSKQGASQDVFDATISALELYEKLFQPIVELSNGEGKRVQLAMALLSRPGMLVLDQPFTGLDISTRKIIHELLDNLKNEGKTIVLIVSEDEIPCNTDHLIEIHNSRVIHRINFEKQDNQICVSEGNKSVELPLRQLLNENNYQFEFAVKMNHVSVHYGEKTILNDISWNVKKGEHWSLTGHNGSGKTTLLSLINADNPQAYVNDISLFDKKRGTGESIWEIKQKIGFVSPELHHYFQPNSSYIETITTAAGDYTLAGYSKERTTCFEAVSSGLTDQVGASSNISSLQKKHIHLWMEAMDIHHLKKKPFYRASMGEQRLVLLARALVKDPPLLILDEPCQGLDKKQTQRFIHTLDIICRHLDKTLIYVSHYENEMPCCIDHRLMLENGKVK